jgi:septation ring formation regulator EzrA
MGYALFANRKIMLTSRINCLQLELMNLENQKQNLLDYSSAIADGYISPEEFSENVGCTSAFNNFYNNAYTNNPNNKALADSATASAQQTYMQEHNNATLTAEQQVEYDSLASAAIQSVIQQYAQNVENKRLASIENRIDTQIKKIETKITAAQNELQSVEQAEAAAIKNATPKYAGLG